MDDLKILHFSDCLFGSKRVDTARVLRDLTRKLLGGNYRYKGQIDYIVICGNITEDHSQASFDLAAEVFGEMAEQLLKQEASDEIQRNRVLIVPGQKDVGDGNNYINFTEFHNKFFAREISSREDRVEAFEPDKVIFRNVKDLTLIGLCHWNIDAPNYTSGSLQTLLEKIEAARDRILQIEYAKRTPTLLVSASNIIFNGDREDWEHFNNIKVAFKEDFETTLHLFGAGRNAGILPTPLTFHHLGIGTGLRYRDGFWPFNINLIELRKERRTEESHDSTLAHFRSSVFQRLPWEGKLERHPWINGQLDTYIKRPRVTCDQFYKTFLETLEKTLKENVFVVIKGFPGSGKRKFFEYITKRDQLKDQKIYVDHISPPNYYDEKRRMAFRNELSAKVESIKAKNLGEEVKVLLVIYDNQFFDLPTGEKGAPFYDLLMEVKNYLLSGDIGGVLYLTNNLDFKPPAIIFGRGGERPSNRTDTVMLPSLHKDEVERLVYEYSTSIPVEYKHLQYLTGGYYGFSDLILTEAEKRFHEEVSGAEPLRRETSTMLTLKALSSPELEEDATNFKRLFLISGANYLQDYIEKKVEVMIRAGELDLSAPPVIEIDVAELKAPIKLKTVRDNITQTIDKLCEMGLLRKDPGARPGRYKLLLMVPFLVGKILLSALPDDEPPGGGDGLDTPDEDSQKKTQVLWPGEKWPPILMADFSRPADFLVITAQDEELEAVRRKLAQCRKGPRTDEHFVYYYSHLPAIHNGKAGVYRLVVMSLRGEEGITAADKVAKAVHKWRPRAVILLGSAAGVIHNSARVGDILVPSQIASWNQLNATDMGSEVPAKFRAIDSKLFNAAFDFKIETCLNIVTVPRPDGGYPEIHYDPLIFNHRPTADEQSREDSLRPPTEMVGVEMKVWSDVLAAIENVRHPKILMVNSVTSVTGVREDETKAEAWRSYARDLAASYVIAYLRRGPLLFRRTGRKSASLDQPQVAEPATADELKAPIKTQAAGEDDFKFDVFLSYSRADTEQVRSIKEELNRAGITTWFDKDEMHYDDGVTVQIEDGLSKSRRILLCLSSVTSSAWVQAEYRAVLNLGISAGQKNRVTPLLLGDVNVNKISPLLADLPRVLYGSDDWNRLIKSILNERQRK